MNPRPPVGRFVFLFYCFKSNCSQLQHRRIRACISVTAQLRPATGCSALIKADKIHPKASLSVPENGSGPMQTAGQISQPMPAPCQSLPSEMKGKATPRGLSCSEPGPSTAVLTCPVFAGRLIAAALAALQNRIWGSSKLLITTIIQW